MKHTDIMFDLEFLSLKLNPVVISIGSVAFNMMDSTIRGPYFYYECDIQEQIDRGRTIDEDTLRWWVGLPDETRSILTHNELPINTIRASMNFVLGWLQTWYARQGGDENIERIWSHGAACDMAILKNLYDDYYLECPWHYRKVRDTKTLFDHANKEDIKKALKPEGETAHHALKDAINQARATQIAWNQIINRKEEV